MAIARPKPQMGAEPIGKPPPALPDTTVHLNAIATATPDHDIHQAFIGWAGEQLVDPREKAVFDRMSARSGIGRRWSVLPETDQGGSPVAPGGFYAEAMPPTSARMQIYAEAAPKLAEAAVRGLPDLSGITHLVVASCTGFTAPGIDQLLADRIGLPGDVERILIGFMGCYGAVTALRTARHIVRSEPQARVLVVTVELSTLHLQPEERLEPLLAMLLFGDGAAAAIVSADNHGFVIHAPFSATLPNSGELIRWAVGDTGFAMHLSGEVPGRIADALGQPDFRNRLCGGLDSAAIDGWAVHAGGRSILDAVEKGLELKPGALDVSRDVLAEHGNMSSATLMFALERLLGGPRIEQGVALAFGPGLAAEGLGFSSAA